MTMALHPAEPQGACPTLADRYARTSSLLLAAVLALQGAGGILFPGLYRDSAWITSLLRAADLDALLLDVPVLLASMALARRGSARARVVWLGALYYAWYNDLYYLLGSAFNRFFLLYVAIFVCASFALVAALLDTDAGAVDAALAPRGRRGAAGILYANAAVLAVMWVGQCLLFVATGKVPQQIVDAGGTTHGVAALDLTTVVPPMLLGASWLVRGRAWGVVIAGGMLVQGLLIVADLALGAPFQQAYGVPGAWTVEPLWAAMGASFAVGLWLLFRRPGASPAVVAAQG
jgi:hypothetical protein